ncbi:hypothetical protein Aperf_G00000083655 [Anoplocephala perfoliata]
MNPYRVIVCREGFSNQVDDKLLSAACTITLLSGPFNILIDPGSPCDGSLVKSILSEHNLKPDDVNYVICSHGHVDHIGNLVDFPGATIIVGTDIMKDGIFEKIRISHDNPYVIDDNVRVIFTPGHTHQDVSIVAKVPDFGTVAVCGDLFENECDRSDPKLWKDNSLNPELQETSRSLILSFADYIVPGHGAMFKGG